MLFEVYADESGCDDYSRVLAIGAYLIEKSAASVMKRKWQRVLDKYHVPYFHMVDVAHGSGIYSGMPDAKLDNMARSMIELVQKYVTWGFAFACPPHRIDDPLNGNDPYSLTVTSVLTAIDSTLSTEIAGDGYDLYIEDGHSSKAKAVQEIERIKRLGSHGKLLSYAFVKKKDAVLLQAADLLVWQFAKNIKDKAFGSRGHRKDFIALTSRKHTAFYHTMVRDRGLTVLDNDPHEVIEARDIQVKQMFRREPFTDPALKEWHDMQFAPGGPRGYFWSGSTSRRLTKATP